jgi:Tfp pilus assembly protein PilO
MTRLHKSLLVNAAWFVGVSAILIVAMLEVLAHVNSRSTLLSDRWHELEERGALPGGPSDLESLAHDLDSMQSALNDLQSMAESESDRVLALSHAAQVAGVQMVAVTSLRSRTDASDPIVRGVHAVEVEGDFRQIAEFLAALQSAEGMIGIDQVQIEREDSTVESALRATLLVTWYGRGPGSPVDDSESEAS